MRDTRVLAAYFIREISKRAESLTLTGVPYSEALRRAVEELRPEITASLKSANLTAEELAEVMKVVA